jgi:hypothetical protein
MRYHRKIFNLFSHTHRAVLKNPTLDLTLKSIVRDYNLVTSKKVSSLDFILASPLKTDNFIKLVSLYFTFYRFYAPAYYYLTGSMEEGIKTYD